MKFNGRNVFVSDSASIGKNVRIGDNSSILDHVILEDNVTIADNCVIGEPLADYYSNTEKYQNPITIIRKGALIRSNALIYAGSEFGQNFSCGHRVTIREYSNFGVNCRVGTLSDIQGHVELGDHCWLHSNVHLGQKSVLGNYVMIYPYVVLTNDPTPPSNTMLGVRVEDFAQIAVFSVLLPGVKIGKHALVGAGSIVGKDVADYSLVLGNPAKHIKDVREIKSRETGEAHYPWPYRFDRGMPWQGVDFDKWQEYND